MKVAIIDYGAGNVKSVSNALLRLGADVSVTSDNAEIMAADKVVFPGVGHAKFAMENLRKSELEALISELKQPVLGICLGFQLMCRHSEEGDTQGLGIFDALVKKFPNGIQKVPHMGWNNVESEKSALFLSLIHI